MGIVVELRPKSVLGDPPRGDRGAVGASEIDAALRSLERRWRAWEVLPLTCRIELLDRVIAETAAIAPEWVARECERKHVAWGSSFAGEEWWNGPWRALHAAHRLRAELTRRGRDGRAAGRVHVATVHRDDAVSSLPFVETIETLFGESSVVLLQVSTAGLARILVRALQPVIDAGFVRVVSGEPVADPSCVTPVIVVPGEWSPAGIERQARVIATMITHGGGFEPGAARVLITDRSWRHRDRLIGALRRVLEGVPNRFAFHLGAHGRFARFLRAHPEIELLGVGHSGSLPWGLITNIDPYSEDISFTTDPFAPILSEIPLSSSSTAGFIDRAVAFCNERLSGTLAAALIADTRCSRDADTRAAFERAIERLDYRIVTINLPPFVGVAFADSGEGTRRHGKAVIRGPFRAITTPPWLVTHSHSDAVFRRLARYEAAPGAAQVPAIVWYSITG